MHDTAEIMEHDLVVRRNNSLVGLTLVDTRGHGDLVYNVEDLVKDIYNHPTHMRSKMVMVMSYDRMSKDNQKMLSLASKVSKVLFSCVRKLL